MASLAVHNSYKIVDAHGLPSYWVLCISFQHFDCSPVPCSMCFAIRFQLAGKVRSC
jgi:hypothetical protein